MTWAHSRLLRAVQRPVESHAVLGGSMGIVPLVLRQYQEEFGVALLGKEHNVGCGWWSQALLSVLVC